MKMLKRSYEARVETVEEAANLIDEEKETTDGSLEYKTISRTKKSKGEVIERWYIVTITRKYS